MTPIDDELRTSLRRRAEGVAPLADPLAGVERRAGQIRRRRVASAVAGTALAAAIVAVGVPAVTQLVTSRPSGFAGDTSPLPPPTFTPSDRADTPLPDNLVPWPMRGTVDVADTARAGAARVLANAELEAGIARQWTAKHGAESSSSKLWGAGLPGGGAAGIWQFWTPGSPSAYTVVGQRQADGLTFIVQDYATPKDVKVISSVLAGGAFPHVIVLGQPKTGQISYAADGRRFRPVERVQGFLGGDGWAVFDRMGAAIGQPLPDLIQVLDGDGRRVYQGQIDVGPSFPDK